MSIHSVLNCSLPTVSLVACVPWYTCALVALFTKEQPLARIVAHIVEFQFPTLVQPPRSYLGSPWRGFLVCWLIDLLSGKNIATLFL